MKPGIYTTEFWISLIGNVLAFAVALGVVTTSDKSTLEGALTTIVMGVPAIIGAVMVIVTYVRGRIQVKASEPVIMAAIDQDSASKAKAAGVPWLTLIIWAIQYGPQLKEIIGQLIDGWKQQRSPAK